MRRLLVATICAVPTLWSAAAQSEPLRPLDFALYIGQTKTRLAYADERRLLDKVPMLLADSA